MLAGSVLASAAIFAAWFPASELVHQRSQLDASSAALAHLDHQNHVLRHEQKQLQTPSAVAHIAEQQYGLVTSADQAYQVLPKSGAGDGGGPLATTATTGTARAASTDGTGAGAGSTGHGSTAAGTAPASATPTSGGFIARIVHTLEFWR